MKKIVFLLLMAVFLAGFMPATEIAYPPWDVSLDAALSELGADNLAVNSDTVLVIAVLSTELSASFSALPETIIIGYFAGQPYDYITGFTNTGQQPEYFLLL